MKKSTLLFLIIILLGNIILYELPSFAVDDPTFYGDGTTAKLDTKSQATIFCTTCCVLEDSIT